MEIDSYEQFTYWMNLFVDNYLYRQFNPVQRSKAQ